MSGTGNPVVARRIMDRCDEIAMLSARPEGIERVYLSQHAAADKLAAGWMTEAGMTTWMDAAGSRCGRIEDVSPACPLSSWGSHLDTVPDAGRYDGVLGVLLAIETARRIAPRAGELPSRWR